MTRDSWWFLAIVGGIGAIVYYVVGNTATVASNPNDLGFTPSAPWLFGPMPSPTQQSVPAPGTNPTIAPGVNLPGINYPANWTGDVSGACGCMAY